MNCDKCGSANTQRVQMVYEAGTQKLDLLGDSGGAANVSSLLASRHAPPPKRRFIGKLFFGFLAFLCVVSGTGKLFYFGLAILILCVYRIFAGLSYNTTVWEGLHKQWREQWLCHKCGHVASRAES